MSLRIRSSALAVLAAALLLGAATPAASLASPRSEARAVARVTRQTARELRALDGLPAHRRRMWDRAFLRCADRLVSVPERAHRALSATFVSSLARAALDPLAAPLSRYRERLGTLHLTDPALRAGRRAWLGELSDFDAIPHVRHTPCATVKLWRRHRYAAGYAPLDSRSVRRVERFIDGDDPFAGKLRIASRQLHHLGVSRAAAAAFTPGGLLAAALDDYSAMYLGLDTATGSCGGDDLNYRGPRFAPGVPPPGLSQSLEILRRRGTDGDRLPQADPEALEELDDLRLVFADYTRLALQTGGGRRFLVVPGRPRVVLMARRCLLRLSADQQRRGRAENRRRRARARGSSLCLAVFDSHGGADGSCVDIEEHRRLHALVVFGNDLPGGRSELAGIAPDRVATVTAQYSHGVTRVTSVKASFFRFELHRKNPFPERLTARDQDGHVIALPWSAIYVSRSSG